MKRKNNGFSTKISVVFALMLLLVSIVALAVGATENEGNNEELEECNGGNCPEDDVDDIIPTDGPKLDVVFVVDSTGSMGDEIREVKTHLIKIIDEVKDGEPAPRLRVGIVTYRDYEPQETEYLYKKLDLTYSIEDAVEFIKQIQASGGGDNEEAVMKGIDVAISELEWDEEASKMMFLIGDAPPNDMGTAQDEDSNQGHEPYTKAAKEKGIKIYTISASGMNEEGIGIWKSIAAATGGEYTELTYERREVEEYYAEEGFDEETTAEYSAAAKSYSDYDGSSNTINVNNLARFALGAAKAQATAAGVIYNDVPETPTDSADDGSTVDTGARLDDGGKEELSLWQRVVEWVVFWK